MESLVTDLFETFQRSTNTKTGLANAYLTQAFGCWLLVVGKLTCHTRIIAGVFGSSLATQHRLWRDNYRTGC